MRQDKEESQEKEERWKKEKETKEEGKKCEKRVAGLNLIFITPPLRSLLKTFFPSTHEIFTLAS